MSQTKKHYVSPRVEKLEFDFNSTVVASTRPGQATFGEDGEQQGTVYSKTYSGCTVYAYAEGCFD